MCTLRHSDQKISFVKGLKFRSHTIYVHADIPQNAGNRISKALNFNIFCLGEDHDIFGQAQGEG